MPDIPGSTTLRAAAIATAASNALPPDSRIATPAAVACGWADATTPASVAARGSGSGDAHPVRTARTASEAARKRIRRMLARERTVHPVGALFVVKDSPSDATYRHLRIEA